MKQEKINEIMENITEDSNLCIIREALGQYGNKEVTTNLKDDCDLDLSSVYRLEVDNNRNGNLNLVAIGTEKDSVIEFQRNDAI